MAIFSSIPVNARWALIVVAIATVWMLSGTTGGDTASDSKTDAPTRIIPTVVTQTLQPQTYTRVIQLVGRSEPLTMVNLAAQTNGTVKKLAVDRGTAVRKGDSLLQIDIATRQADLTAAQAQVKAAQVLVETTRRLLKEGFAAETKLAEQEAELATAQQNLASIQKDITYTKVTAPINGVIEDRFIDIGDYVDVGTPLFNLVGRDAFLLVGYVAQQDQQSIQSGQFATATLANGQKVEGTVRFIATNAKPETKTYRVDVLVDGKKFQIPTGMTADIQLPVEKMQAYLLPHSLLVLADDGTVGVMGLEDKEDKAFAKFTAITPLEDTPKGLWIAGLPEGSFQIITRGQAAVADGAEIVVAEQKEAE
ncbi:MAG: efflux RND transporter periplasmic adaptor subunit [Alphaproteobacteria bacterium]|nr:efflux RND transporter periplasmic adaptor subunit [Alphaproteobacteria bacterium]MDD9920296.1 efflux RND transporter periplasmic adaptor subunit [Alphaproteobacteria bacterium]